MAGFDGNGNYVRPYNWTNDAANNIPITASRFDTDGDDVAAAFGICLTRDNQGKPTTTLSWAQTLNLTKGSNAAIFSLGRTGGTNNPVATFSVNETTGLSLATSYTSAPTLTIAGSGSAAGTALGLTSSATTHFQIAGSGQTIGSGGGAFDIAQAASGLATVVNGAAERLRIGTNGVSNMEFSIAGGATLTAPTGEATLTVPQDVTNANGAIAVGTSATAICFSFAAANTGASLGTIIANKPGGASNTTSWIRVLVNGVTGYIPVF
jgi:hypothetical protein